MCLRVSLSLYIYIYIYIYMCVTMCVCMGECLSVSLSLSLLVCYSFYLFSIYKNIIREIHGLQRVDNPVLADQQKLTFIRTVRTLGGVNTTYNEGWLTGTVGEIRSVGTVWYRCCCCWWWWSNNFHSTKRFAT